MTFAYVDAALESADGAAGLVQHLHWGLFGDPDVVDDSPARYLAAAEAMTEPMVSAATIADGHSVLDVGCGFGGTLAHIRHRTPACHLTGLNIDPRQLTTARRLTQADPDGNTASVPADAAGTAGRVCWLAGDGCRLPVRTASVDRLLAVECVFHFPSRKAFFAEAARVLRPGGTLTLSDFLVAPGALATVARALSSSVDGAGWYGPLIRPLTVAGYERLAHRSGLDVVTNTDVTRQTLPTYPALRRLARESSSTAGLPEVTALETLAQATHLTYNILTFHRRSPIPSRPLAD